MNTKKREATYAFAGLVKDGILSLEEAAKRANTGFALLFPTRLDVSLTINMLKQQWCHESNHDTTATV